MIALLKLNLPKEMIIHIINFNLYLHKQNSIKVIKYNKILQLLPKIKCNSIAKPYIIVNSNKTFNNKKLVKFIYTINNYNIIIYFFIEKNIQSNKLIEFYNNEFK